MNTATLERPRPPASTVILLHSSGSSARQWEGLIEALRPRYRVRAVEFHGHGMRAPRDAISPMRLADDAALVSPLLHEAGAAHVVGHSYGAAVALKLASMHSARVRSLVAYEPVLFRWLLDDAGSASPLQDILSVVQSMREGLARGDERSAARLFVDCWSGKGSWDALPGSRQGPIATRMHAVLQHFDALFAEPLAGWQVASLGMPMLFLSGACTVPAARRIAELSRLAVPHARHAVLAGMGHMGPITHASAVNHWIAGFLHAQLPLEAAAVT
jgi:pimeloyl-ACP methyl ester carboxylesterase